jgi:hypothetical protein
MPFFLEKIPLIYWLLYFLWSYSPELLKKDEFIIIIPENPLWIPHIVITKKNWKLKQNNKKSRKILKKGILLHTTQSKMYCSILVSCLNKRLQSGGIEKKKWKKNCSKMTKLKRKERTKKSEFTYFAISERYHSGWKGYTK